jgi:hypothetical protein
VRTQSSFLSQPLQFELVLANPALVERLGKHLKWFHQTFQRHSRLRDEFDEDYACMIRGGGYLPIPAPPAR